MKRKLALIILCSMLVFSVCGLVACETNVHTHELEKVEAVAATCTEVGNKEYYRCKSCDKIFADENYTEISAEETIISALGHDLEHHDEKSATCTEDGWKAYDTCKHEGCEYTTYEKILATHTPSEAVKENEVAASCETEGSYDLVVYCSVCEKELSRETKTVETLGHTHADAVKENEVAATCEKEGSYDLVVYCSVCEKEISRESKTIAALGHDEVIDEAVEPTCTADGLSEGKHCSVCQKVLVKQELVKSDGHDYKATVIEPTYTDQGYTLHKCEKCGDEYKDAYTDVLVHTCQSKCDVCGGCLNDDCDFDVCVDNPCSCVTLRQEAELVVSNRNGLTSAGNAPTNREDSNASNGIFLRAINECSNERPGYYYFKWSITVEKACKVEVFIGIGAPSDITDVAAAFPAKLNGEEIKFNGPITANGWTNFSSQSLGIIDLSEGNNILYIYIGSGAKCNLDYLEFSSPETLTFNETTAYDNVYRKEAEDADYYRGLLEDGSRIRKNANANASGGYTIGGIGEIASQASGEFYLKWSIQAEKACIVTVSINIAANSVTKKSFIAKLNGEEVVLGNNLLNTSWTTYTTQTMGIIDLVAGNNEFYIYFSGTAQCNIDYFEFSSNQALTFDNIRTYSYKQEAENSDYNTDVLESGDRIRVNTSETASGGKYLGGIGEVSSKAPSVYYFKWTITAEKDCVAEISINLAAYSLTNNCFTGYVNGNKLYLNGSELSQLGWSSYSTQSMGIVDLKAGENEFSIYLTAAALCNIDYFVFASDAELSFS